MHKKTKKTLICGVLSGLMIFSALGTQAAERGNRNGMNGGPGGGI